MNVQQRLRNFLDRQARQSGHAPLWRGTDAVCTRCGVAAAWLDVEGRYGGTMASARSRCFKEEERDG